MKPSARVKVLVEYIIQRIAEGDFDVSRLFYPTIGKFCRWPSTILWIKILVIPYSTLPVTSSFSSDFVCAV